MADCKPRVLRRDCKETTSGGTDEKQCPSFSFCAGNKTVSFDGECMTVTDRTYQIPDGTYSTVTFKDGCVVGVGQAPVVGYTPNECCGPAGSGGENGGDVTISAHPANLLKDTPDGLAVMPVIKGSGVSVKGSGTLSDPFIITASSSGGSGVVITSGSPTALTVERAGTDHTDPIEVALKSVMQSGRYGPFTINEFGQVTDFDKDNNYIKGIRVEPPLELKEENGEVTISLNMALLSAMMGNQNTGKSNQGTAPSGYYVSRTTRKVNVFSDNTYADYTVNGPVGGWVSFDSGGFGSPVVKQIGDSGSVTFSKALFSGGNTGFNQTDTVVIRAAGNEQMTGAVTIYTKQESISRQTDGGSNA